MEVKIIENEKARIGVLLYGGELVSYRIKTNGKEIPLLYRDGDTSVPESGWKNHATVLFPTVGRLKNKKSRIGNKEIYFEKNHGIARSQQFSLIEKTKDSILLQLKSNEDTKKFFPFDFILNIKYTLKDEILTTCFEVINPSEESLYFGLGWHPGFRTESDFEIIPEFKTAERFFVSESGLLTGEKKIISKEEFEKILKSDLSNAVILRIENKNERKVIYKNNEISLGIEFYDFEFLGIWSEDKRKFICIEPWQGTDDFENQTTFDKKPGIVKLEPGESKVFEVKLIPYL